MDEQRKNPFRRGRATEGREQPARRPGLRKLPADLHDLANGTVNRLRRPRRPEEPVQDDAKHVLPGVRNSEARAVYDSRVAQLRAALQRGDDAALARGLFEARCLGLWRARNVTDFEAFAEHVLGLDSARTQALAVNHAVVDGAWPSPLGRELVALWVRVEAALLQCGMAGAVQLAGTAGAPSLQLSIAAEPTARGIQALCSLGPALVGLAKLIGVDAPVEAPPERRPRR